MKNNHITVREIRRVSPNDCARSNVICTGVTASAALEVLPDATVVALAMSSWR